MDSKNFNEGFLAVLVIVGLLVGLALGATISDDNAQCVYTDVAGIEELAERDIHYDYRDGAWHLDGRLTAYAPSEDTVVTVCVDRDLTDRDD